MANCSRGRGRQSRPVPVQPLTPADPVTVEPPVRRWPHPINGIEPVHQADPTLHYIRCALSYQNQLLADIKALLQQIVESQEKQEQAD
ncbi:hypothetical protein SAMN05216343_11192 [Oscillibacter sp. PC13]|uniref:hypothetical protein n=1 Tax=Oscillibacter sp. PC13 TaxID=1855299 RepID=UPI0008E7E8BF|nr:hypothetical protein [Oscillibacter sp. PC13]SFP66301.1 hypothetical protein SAMN05216343_11192 [Oscillibacter sp. PC13]